MNYLYLDIETVPALPREVVADLIAHRQDKDPDRYAATCPWLCDIVCVGTALNDDEPMVLDGVLPLMRYLGQLFDSLKDPLTLVTFNGREFDVPAIAHSWAMDDEISRALEPPSVRSAARWMLSLKDVKPWIADRDKPHIDLLDVMRQGTRRPCSFREACIAYGVGDPKAECDGSQVQDLVARGDIDAVHRYCRSDVVFLRKLHKAMRGLLS
jgi:hypothetical protein